MPSPWPLRFAFASLVTLSLALTQTRPSLDGVTGKWYKGNLHTHTLNSDGDSSPLEVATWYREHGYQFLALTDHNIFTDPTGLNAILAAREKFVLIPAEELTDSYAKRPIHINGLNLAKEVQPLHGASVSETIQRDIDHIRAAGGLPSLNHPNFNWAVTAADMAKVKNLRVFEVFNGHPTVNNVGGGGSPSLEEMWDVLLTGGQQIYGIAVDDAHVFKQTGQEFSNPGRGWVVVRAESLTPANITRAIEDGRFYASSGVQLIEVVTSANEYRIEIKERPQEKFTTYFIGAGGKVLDKTFDTIPVYKYKGGEKYVRARVESSFGVTAWTQPVFR